MRAPILVTGFPRSGTSLLAGILHHCGAWTGETLAGDVHNPKGYFENERLHGTYAFYADIMDPATWKIPDPYDVEQMKSNILKYLTVQRYDGDRPWLYKASFTVTHAKQWLEIFPDAYWIYASREPFDILESCMNVWDRGERDAWIHSMCKFSELWMKTCARLLKCENRTMMDMGLVAAGDLSKVRAFVEEYDGLEWTQEAEDFVDPKLWKRWKK